MAQNTDEVTSEIDIPSIDNDKGIENSGSPMLFKELLGDVYGKIDDKCDAIRSHLKNNDIKSYTTEVHALKTTCRMMGAMELAENFYTLEKLGTDNNVSKIEEDTPGVLAAFSALKPYLEPYAKVKSEPEKEYDKTSVMEVLNRLEAAIGDFDLTAAEACTDELAEYVFDESMAAKIKRLCELVGDLDYDEAGEMIEGVKAAL
ncbi:MAG: Hpt domain-containing protein [Eubacterium sp.]|nr:Hpt domain-containing protein [Eubacterium sp.]MBQ7200983.1 Hpt domain-containing protein [Eubacterium sp.]